MKKGQEWFEKILQCCIILTGSYIIYRSAAILAETGWINRLLHSEETAQVLQEMTVQTYFPGYVTVLEQLPKESPVKKWMEKMLPVLQEWYEQAQKTAEREKKKKAGEETESTGQEENMEAERAGRENATETETESIGREDEGETERNSQEESAETERKSTGREEKRETEAVTEAAAERKSETEAETAAAETETEAARIQETFGASAENLGNFETLLNHYFVVDSDTRIREEQLNVKRFLETDLSIEKKEAVPQILIYHTHSQEYFLDSTEGDLNTGIVGIGTYLTELLEEKYGYCVIHNTEVYDLVDGVLDRSAAYDYARTSVEKLLEEYPSLEVLLDLHRDGVEGEHFVTEIDGKATARIMFFNGLSADSNGEAISYLPNPYIEENLAFSFQLQLAAEKAYPGFTRNIYLKGQRFNLHLRPRSLLVEAGTQLNTIEEEKNAMEVLALLLDQILT